MDNGSTARRAHPPVLSSQRSAPGEDAGDHVRGPVTSLAGPRTGDSRSASQPKDSGNDANVNSQLDGENAASAPIFWTTRQSRSTSTASYGSIDHLKPAPISLEDHSGENDELSQSCWAQSATIDEFVVVSGATGIGAYVVWHCTVKTLRGGDIGIRKRYSEFDQLRTDLIRSFPHAEAMIPPLPRKSLVSRFRPWFLEQRQAGLSHFLNCILLNPEFAASPVLKDFIFS